MSITTNETLKNDLESKIIKQKFYIACEEDDSSLVKEFLTMKVINPCEMGYKLLRYAIEKKAVKIVDAILESEFFSDFANDTKYALKVASKIGDSDFAIHMLK